jgi:hypothetical protein
MKERMPRGRRVARALDLGLERLEIRLVLNADAWTGATSSSWNLAGNWNPAAIPAAGDTLSFPGTATSLTSTDDLTTADLSIAGLTVGASGYDISAISGNSITLTGTLDSDQTTGSSTVALPITMGTGGGTVQVDNSAATLVLSGAITGSSTVTTTGPGKVQVDGTIAQGVDVTNSSVLSGTGTVGSITTSTTSNVDPGDAGVGNLTVTGALTLDSTSSLNVTLNGDTTGTYSELTVDNAINLNSATLNVASIGYTPTGNDQYTIINNPNGSTITGTFAGLAQNAIFTSNGQQFQISYTGGSNGKDVVLTRLFTSQTLLAATPNTTPVYGQALTLTATVSPTGSETGTPTGTVEFYNGTTLLGSSTLATVNNSQQATYAPTSLVTGTTYSFTADYQGNSTFGTSDSSPAITVTPTQALTSTALTTTPNPSSIGSAVTFTATVTATSPGAGTPTGTVSFMNETANPPTTIGTSNLSNGSATYTDSALPLGTTSIEAVYSGDTNFDTSTSTAVSQSVLLGTTTSVASSASSIVYGQTVTLTATIAPSGSSSGAITGTVNFTSGGNAIGTANVEPGPGSTYVAVLTTNILPTDTGSTPNSITGVYSGDSTYGTSTSSATTVTVSQASTTTSLASSVNPSGASQQVTFTATITPVSPSTGTPTGSVTFNSGSTTLGTATLTDGTATLAVTTLAAGSNPISAVYSSDTNYLASTSPTLTQVVNEDTSTTTLTVSSTNPFAYQSVTLSVTVDPTGTETGTPTGTVTFTTSGGTVLGTATLAGGSGSLTLNTIPAGNNSIVATYGGDSTFGSSVSTATTIVVGSANELYINQVFQQTTGQAADGGLVYWTDTLNAGYSRAFVVSNILKSAQASGHTINAAYERFLDRGATATETNAALAGRGASINTLDASILGSDEFYRTQGKGTTSGFLDALAEAWLGTTFSASTKAHYTQQLNHGTTRYRIAQEVINSPTGRAAEVNYYYEQILGRPADKKGLKTYTAVLAKTGNVSQVIDSLLASEEFYRTNSAI